MHGVSEAKESHGAAVLLKALQKDVFTEAVRISVPRKKSFAGRGMVDEYPLEIIVDDIEALGRVVNVPADMRKTGTGVEPEIDPETGDPVKPKGGEDFPVAEGHHIYGWQAVAVLAIEDITKADKIASRLTKEMTGAIKTSLKGTVTKAESKSDTTGDEPTATTAGIFTSSIEPEAMGHALKERFGGMRSILPKGVRESSRVLSILKRL